MGLPVLSWAGPFPLTAGLGLKEAFVKETQPGALSFSRTLGQASRGDTGGAGERGGMCSAPPGLGTEIARKLV